MTERLLAERYATLATSDSPQVRRLAGAQLEKLQRAQAPVPRGSEPTPASGLLVSLVERVVGPLQQRPSGEREGSCPWHGSRSGQCLVVFADGRHWWCRSCRRGGDVVAWLALVEGISVGEARRRLGLPAPRRQPRPCRRVMTYA
jgi:hypothetical protein